MERDLAQLTKQRSGSTDNHCKLVEHNNYYNEYLLFQLLSMTSNNLSKEITFFSTGPVRREVFEPIATEAEKRGYETSYTDDHSTEAEIGFYNEHTYRIDQVNSTMSAITVHSLDCLYGENHWITEPWSQFDIGFVPGAVTAKNWQDCSWYPKARPSMGVFRTGWTKADPIRTDQFSKSVNDLARQIGLSEGKTALFAPIAATDEKLQDFVESANQFENLLVKTHPSYDPDLSDITEPKLTVLSPKTEIFKASAVADVLVADESSVLQEAILTETIPVSVVDWISGSSKTETAGSHIPDFAIKTNRQNLRETLCLIIEEYDTHVERIRDAQHKHFDNIGHSSVVTMDIIDEIVAHGQPQRPPIEPDYSTFEAVYGNFREFLVDYIPERAKEPLRSMRVDEAMFKIDKRF